jgi:hypothetical protein
MVPLNVCDKITKSQLSKSDKVTKRKVGTTTEGRTIRVSFENYAKILQVKAKLLLKDTRELKDRKDFSENDVVTYLFQNQKEET